MIIEYTLRTRLDIVRTEQGEYLRRLKVTWWFIKTERVRRRSLARAAGLQANGRPAFDVYGPNNRQPLLYFDTRLRSSDFIGTDAAAKAEGVKAGAPLRLAYSGRLERLKGAHYLLPIASRLKQKGVPFTLDIFGDGSMRSQMQADAAVGGLSEIVTFHGPVDFDTALVPTLKSSIDLFLCCHPQADPSCTYLETLGCGVPIVGFANEAFRGVLDLGPCGLSSPIGDSDGVADHVARLSADRAELARLTLGAAEVAGPRLFENTFVQRVGHLKAVAGLS